MVASPAPRALLAPLLAPLLAGLAVAAALVLAGCTYTTPMDTQRSMVPGDGLNFRLSPSVTVASLLVVTEAEGDPGVLVARVVNSGAEAAQVDISGSGVAEQVSVPAGETLSIGGVAKGSEKVVIDSVDEAPGYLVPMTFSVDGAEREVRAPVLDGALEQYRPYLRQAESS